MTPDTVPPEDGVGALSAALARLQPALAEAQARLAGLDDGGGDAGPDEAFAEVLGLDGAVLFVSGGLAAIDADEAEHQGGFWLRQGSEAAWRAMAAARAGQVSQFQAEAGIGARVQWDVMVSPLRAADGTLDALLVTSRPAGTVHSTAEALQDALERLDLALLAGPVIGTWMWDVVANRVTCDSRLAQAFAVDPAQAATGLPLETFLANIDPGDRSRVAALIARTVRTGGRYEAEYRLTQADGSVRWVQASGQCQTDGAGRAVRFPGVLVDVHDRVLAEAAMRAKVEWQTGLLGLGDRLRDATDAAAIADLSGGLVGRLLSATNVGYAEIDPKLRQFTIRRDWTDGRVPSVAGRYDYAAFGGVMERLEQGHVIVADDLWNAPWLPAADLASYRALGIRALVNLPLLRDGRLVGAMFVGSAEPRAWTDDEVQLIHDVADRAWGAIERVAAEVAVRASAAELRLVADAMPVMISLIDRDLVYRFINQASQIWFGREPDQVVGRPMAEVVGAEGMAWRTPYIASALAGREVLIEVGWPHLDGTPRAAEIRYLPRRNPEGLTDGFYAFILDITERKRAEQTLQGSAEMLEAEVARRTAERDRMWRLSTDMMLAARFDGRIEAVNPAWTALLGWTEAELVGASLLDVVCPDDADITRAAMQRLADGERTGRHENRCRHRDGSLRWISWSAVPDSHLVHAAGRDITAERESGALQSQLEDQLRQSQKMEAVGQLTGGLAHDFNNLLTGISGSLELLNERVAEGRTDGLERYILAAQDAAGRAAALTHRLLAFSRRQTLEPLPTSLNRLITGMKELIQRTVGPAIQVDTALADGLWPTLCDPNQLENALLNLCINARDAMPQGGRLTVETANAWMDDRIAQEHDMPPGEYVAMSVTDTGTGMTPETASRAFDPFFTTKPIGEGTGLGLSMIYGFVRQSGGQVRIYTQLGQGTTMRLYLPRHAQEAAPVPVAAPLRAPRAARGETVLVVDDEPTIRMLVVEVLERLGYVALLAGDGMSALAILGATPGVDLLVTDMGLPGGMNGRQLAAAARAGRPALKVLFITGYAAGTTAEQGGNVLVKPFTMDALGTKIRAVLAEG